MECLTFLGRIAKLKPQPAYVLFGNEPFLKTQARHAIRRLVLGDDDGGFAESSHDGDKATWAAVHDDLMTVPMLSPRRLVFVDDADAFVTRERARLERLFADRAGLTDPTGVLVLDVSKWQSNTKLAKQTPDLWLIVCDTPASHQLPQWCVEWCQARHGKQLAAAAARWLVDLVGPQMGQLDMELEKLAVYVGDSPKIDQRDVDTLVGNSRLQEVWGIFDLIGAGKGGEALAFLQRMFDQGKDPMMILGAFSSKMRGIAQAARLAANGMPLHEALARADIPPFGRGPAEQQIRHLGRRRLDRLYDWLLETDQGMKGGSQLTPRQLLERLVVQLARART